MLSKTLNKLKMQSESEVVSGAKNLELSSKLKNQGHVKRLMHSFMQQDAAISSILSDSTHAKLNELKYDKRAFIPFVDERD